MDARERLIALAVVYRGDWSAIAKALKKKEVYETEVLPSALTIYDNEYPLELRRLRFPPWVLFFEGDINLLKQPMITVVGSREMNRYTEEATIKITRELSKRFVIVSGLAKGVDGLAHETAMDYGGKTIGVIGCGIDIRYPKVNEHLYQKMSSNQLILSEYPPHTGVARHHFPWRNRILAALGQELIVTGATDRSGTMLTVNEALNLSKNVWCVPHPFEDVYGMGCNRLISQGAGILFSVEQLEDINVKRKELANALPFGLS